MLNADYETSVRVGYEHSICLGHQCFNFSHHYIIKNFLMELKINGTP